MTRMLREQLGAVDAVVAGLGAMIGAGLFAGLAPASSLAGGWLLVAMVVAAVAAACCCCSTCDQSGVFPGSGSGYRYTREQLGRWPGRMAGGLYLASRAAAAAALAACFGAYVAPDRPTLAALGVLVLAVVADAVGVRPPRALTRALTVFVLVVLALVVAACFAIAPPPPTGVPLPAGTPGLDDPGELLPAAGVLFFAFLGFERVHRRGIRGQAAAGGVRCGRLRGHGGDELIQAVARRLGFKRTGSRIQARTEACLAGLIATGQVSRTADGRLQVTPRTASV